MNFFRDDPKIRFAVTSGDSDYLPEIPLFSKHNLLMQPVVSQGSSLESRKLFRAPIDELEPEPVTDKPELSVTIIIVIINHIATRGLSVQIQEFDAFSSHCHGLRPGARRDDLREGGFCCSRRDDKRSGRTTRWES